VTRLVRTRAPALPPTSAEAGAAGEGSGATDATAPATTTTTTTTTTTPPPPPDLVFTALAVSRDGTRVAALSGAPVHGLALWDTTTGGELHPSRPTRFPTTLGVLTDASFSPGDRGLLAASGASGLVFVRTARSYHFVETALALAAAPAPRAAPPLTAALAALPAEAEADIREAVAAGRGGADDAALAALLGVDSAAPGAPPRGPAVGALPGAAGEGGIAAA
jgi:hypothetical protein